MIKHLFQKKVTTLDHQVELAKQGDEMTRNDMLKKYQPFIAKSVSEVCKRYIDPTKDDEFSIGLLAFDEAIEAYSDEKGCSFLSFARLVIKRKVIDYIRNEQKYPTLSSLDEEYYDEEQMENPSEVAAAKDRFQMETESWHRQQEIGEFKEQLKQYKMSFEDLIEASPKHRDARESAVQVARLVFEDDDLKQQVLEKGRLPIKSLIDRVEVSKKTLERNRKFIIALVLIFHGDYVYLKDYLKGVGL